MKCFDWEGNKEELLAEMRNVLADLFEGTGYTIVRNPTPGEVMNNIYYSGSDKRAAYIIPLRRRKTFVFAIQIEYLPAVQASGAKLGKPEEIKKNKYPNWKKFKDVSYDDLRIALSAFVKHS